MREHRPIRTTGVDDARARNAPCADRSGSLTFVSRSRRHVDDIVVSLRRPSHRRLRPSAAASALPPDRSRQLLGRVRRPERMLEESRLGSLERKEDAHV